MVKIKIFAKAYFKWKTYLIILFRPLLKPNYNCWDSQLAGNMRCIGCRANRLCEWKIFTCEPYRAGGSNSNNNTCDISINKII